MTLRATTSRISLFALAMGLALLPVLERICDLACAEPAAAVESAGSGGSHCRPEPASDRDPPVESRGHGDACSHDHEIQGRVAGFSTTKGELRPSVDPAVLSSLAAVAVGGALRTNARGVQPSESPPPRASSPVLRV